MGSIKTTLLSAMTFAGNANLFKLVGLQQFYVFPVSILLSVIYLPMMRLNYDLLKIVLMSIFVSYFLFVNIFQHMAANLLYVIWPLNCFILGIFFAEFFKNIDSTDVRPFLILPLIIVIGLLISGLDSRSTFFFGPNVLYRIFLLFGAILFFYSKTSFFSFLGLAVMVLGATTGSRGYVAGLFVIFLFSVLIFFRDKKFNSMSRLVFLLISAPILSFIFIQIMNDRIFFFDPASISSLSRLETLNFVVSNWQIMFNLTGLDSFELSKYFGYGNALAYPHNFILEAYLYYGFIGLMLTLLILLMAFFSAKDLKQTCLLSLVVVFCSLSGDFGDNYIVYSFCFGLILNRLGHKEQKYSV